jgi:di/tricarboxylate transporter
MVASVTGGVLSMLNASMLAAGLMIATRCTSAAIALRAVDWQVLLVIAAALGIGQAMETSGAARTLTNSLLVFAGSDPHLILAIILAVTMFFTNVVNAKAAAVLMFPIGISAAARLSAELGVSVSPLPFVIAIMVGSAASYATPIGYQTNLMVMGPGGYRFSDYLRVGVPLSLLVFGIATWLIPQFWPF